MTSPVVIAILALALVVSSVLLILLHHSEKPETIKNAIDRISTRLFGPNRTGGPFHYIDSSTSPDRATDVIEFGLPGSNQVVGTISIGPGGIIIHATTPETVAQLKNLVGRLCTIRLLR